MGERNATATKVSKTCSITNPPGKDGKCYVTLTSTDTDTEGDYIGELHLAGTGTSFTSRQFNVTIVADLP